MKIDTESELMPLHERVGETFLLRDLEAPQKCILHFGWNIQDKYDLFEFLVLSSGMFLRHHWHKKRVLIVQGES